MATSKSNEQQAVGTRYRQLSREKQVVFCSLINLAFVLLQGMQQDGEKKGDDKNE